MGFDTQLLPDNVLTLQLKHVVNWARRSSLWPMPFATACWMAASTVVPPGEVRGGGDALQPAPE